MVILAYYQREVIPRQALVENATNDLMPVISRIKERCPSLPIRDVWVCPRDSGW